MITVTIDKNQKPYSKLTFLDTELSAASKYYDKMVDCAYKACGKKDSYDLWLKSEKYGDIHTEINYNR